MSVSVRVEEAATVAASPPRRVARRTRRDLLPYLFVLPAVLFLSALLAYPLLLNVIMSVQDRTAANLLDGSAPWVGLDNYRAAFADPQFAAAARHSVVFAVTSVAVQLCIGLGLALFYARSFPGARTMRALYLIGYAVPVVITAQVYRWLLDGHTGFVNWILGVQSEPIYWLTDPGLALPALIVAQVWLGVPYTMVNLLAGLTQIPAELHEAAAIDGAGPWRRFRYVTLPLLRPVIAATAVLSLIFTFKTFDLVWIATQGGPAGATEILPTLAYRSVFGEFLFGKGAAILNVVFAALFLLSIVYLWSLRREES